jgi:hypothetical protein
MIKLDETHAYADLASMVIWQTCGWAVTAYLAMFDQSF